MDIGHGGFLGRKCSFDDYIIHGSVSFVQRLQSSPFLTLLHTIMPDESISLEETNKIRISLGLKPLVDDKTAGKTETKEQEAENNYKKQREQEAKDRELKCVRSVVH